MKKIIILIISCFMLTGCFNYVELNKIAIVSSIGIDKVGDNYLVSVQIMNSKESKESEGSQVTVYSEEASSILYALRKITMESPRKLNGSHLSKLVVSKEVAKEGIIDILDMFERISLAKEEFTICIIDNASANDALKILTTTENIPAEYVRQTLEAASNYTSLTYSTKMDEFLSLYLKKYIDPVIPVIAIENYEEKGKTLDNINTTDPYSKIKVLEKLGITKDGKVIDYINKNEIIGYNLLNNKLKDTILPIKCDDNNYSSLEIKNKTKYDVSKRNNKYTITYNLNMDAELQEYNCNKNLKDKNNIKEIENKLKKQIKKYIEASIKKQKNSKSNFLGLKRKVYLKNSNYNNEEIKVKYKININIPKKGQLNNSIKGEKNE